MIGRRLLVALSVTAIGLMTIAAVVSAQTERKTATLDDLVAEMRGLRADLNQTAGATMRMQLLTARLTLQEQRIAVLSNQRADLLTRLAAAVRERSEIEARVKHLQEEIQDVPSQMHDQVAAMLKSESLTLSQHLRAEQDLRLQETDLTATITSEQGRWQDFNARLDDLDRSLTQGRSR
jgi:chromosome segregation ATPase